MPWALGQAVADLFARIAAALTGQTVGGISPLPPNSNPAPAPPPQPPSGPPAGGIIQEPPFVGTPPPVGPPPVVTVPPVELFPTPPLEPPPQPDCPILSLSDRIAIAALQYTRPPPPQSTTTPAVTTSDDMGVNYNAVTILESTDMFRFRAISTSDVVPVTFFGRIRTSGGSIVPFAHPLTTATANTIYETIVPTGAGVLLGAAASVPVGSITAGSVSAVGEIGRVNGTTFTPHTLLFSGQLDDLTPLAAGNVNPPTPLNRVSFDFFNETPQRGAAVQQDHYASLRLAYAVYSSRVRLPMRSIGQNEIPHAVFPQRRASLAERVLSVVSYRGPEWRV